MPKPTKTPKPAPARSRKAQPVSTLAKSGSKMANLIDLMSRPSGATLDEIAAATSWQHHSIRGAISGHLKKKLGLTVSSSKSDDGKRHYKIAA